MCLAAVDIWVKAADERCQIFILKHPVCRGQEKGNLRKNYDFETFQIKF